MTGGVLLTGGASRRMGADKAQLRRGGVTLAARAAGVLSEVCEPVAEVGPGHSALPAVWEQPAGSGPLGALLAGAAALRARGHAGDVLLLGVDLPFVEASLLRLLAAHPAAGVVVPVSDGVPQVACARYGADALAVAADCYKGGARSLRAVLDAPAVTVTLIDEATWRTVAPPGALVDVNTPRDAARAGVERPG